mmetsp:Transcript_125850/g.221575  ORF Transcript_125850/g.221575 Transcript_125850/m.221575 type:complete len:89 (-) Transcript_125850:7-273(-)
MSGEATPSYADENVHWQAYGLALRARRAMSGEKAQSNANEKSGRTWFSMGSAVQDASLCRFTACACHVFAIETTVEHQGNMRRLSGRA